MIICRQMTTANHCRSDTVTAINQQTSLCHAHPYSKVILNAGASKCVFVFLDSDQT